MSDERADRIKRILKTMFDVHGVGRGLDRESKRDVMLMWLQALADLTPEEVLTAVNRFNNECREYPTPARLRGYATSARIASVEQRAEIGWAQLHAAIKKYGGYTSVDFEDRVINAAVRQLGGWEQVSAVKTLDVVWLKKDFLKAYETVCQTAIGDASPLRGITNGTNGSQGHKLDEVVRIETSLPQHVAAARLERREPSNPAIEGYARGIAHVAELRHFGTESGATTGTSVSAGSTG